MHPHGIPKPRLTDALDEAQRRCDAGMPPAQWFDRKVRGHMEACAGLPSESVPPPRADAALRERLNQPARRRRTIYVHVPFCKRICSFCAFFRQPTGRSDLEAYTQAVAAQIDATAQATWAQDGPPFDAVYFGGGTPTALAPKQLARLVTSIRNQYPLADDCEFTVECRFDGLDEYYLKQLHDAQVNRLSFGVQSFDTAVRRGVGRIADRDQVVETIGLAARLGFEQISVDLIYNLPEQTLTSWASDMDTLRQTPATAASVYALIPMRSSALVKQIEAGRKQPLGDCSREYEMFTAAYDALMKRPRWRRFSFHHFGDAQHERSVYNQVRSGGMDTLGLGCGAGGQIGHLSYMNPMDVGAYVESQSTGGAPPAMVAEQPEAVGERRGAYRLTESGGIDRSDLFELLPHAQPVVDRLIDLGLIVEEAGRLEPTRDGCFWGYNLTAMLTELIGDRRVVSPAGGPARSRSRLLTQGVAECSS